MDPWKERALRAEQDVVKLHRQAMELAAALESALER